MTPEGNHDNAVEMDEMTDAEKASLVDSLLEEMRELFHGYIGGEFEFDEVTFETFDTLQTLHAIANGTLVIEYYDDDDEYEEFDELAGEPTGDGQGAGANGGGRGKGQKGGQRGRR
jgi:hypothetical protein